MNYKDEISSEFLGELIKDDQDKRLDVVRSLELLFMRYESALREIRTKLEILNDELSLKSHSPISYISSRRKSTMSIFEKLKRQGDPLTLKSIEENIHDVAGIRVICSFVDDIYKVADMLVQQDDVELVQVKDYIKYPKENGYRSYHMIIKVPVFFSHEKRPMKVEVQIRTVGMNFWATLEHQMKYKKEISNASTVIEDLKQCADTIAKTDTKMMQIREQINNEF